MQAIDISVNMKKPKFKRFCPSGHDTWVVGRNKWKYCKRCANIRRDLRREKTELSRLKRRTKDRLKYRRKQNNANRL